MKTTINLDYLIINFEFGGTFNDFPDFRVLEQTYGTKRFRRIHTIIYKNRVLGTFYSVPTNPDFYHCREKFSQLQIENFWFYEGLQALRSVLFDFMAMANSKFHSFSRIDLALDSCVYGSNENDYNGINPDFIFNFVRNIQNNSWILDGKEKAIVLNTTSKNRYTGFSVGSRVSDVFCRVYHKSEQMVKEPKAWIMSRHDAYDMVNVWRVEFELKKGYMKLIPDFDFIFSSRNLLKIFENLSKKYLCVRVNMMHRQIEQNPIKPIFEFSKVANCDRDNMRFSGSKPKADSLTNKTVQQKKMMLKQLFSVYFYDKQSSFLPLVYCARISESSAYFNEYFHRSIWKWVSSFESMNLCENFRFDFEEFSKDYTDAKQCDV